MKSTLIPANEFLPAGRHGAVPLSCRIYFGICISRQTLKQETDPETSSG